MVKKFYLIFGVRNLSVKQISNIIEKQLNISFIKHDSSYAGLYNKYSGPVSDAIIIQEFSKESLLLGCEIDSNFSTSIYVINNKGKNHAKEERNLNIKSHLLKIVECSLLNESIESE